LQGPTVTISTPGMPFIASMTRLALASTTGMHQYEVGISATVRLRDTSEGSNLRASAKFRDLFQ
jgi:hypothetical protein